MKSKTSISTCASSRLDSTKRKVGQKNKKIENLILSLVIGCALFMVGLYVFQVNNLAASGFKLSELDQKIIFLEKEIENLRAQTLKSQSIDSLEKESQKLGMVHISSPEFLDLKKEMALK